MVRNVGIQMVRLVTWRYHLNTGPHTVRYSDESSIQVFGIQMATVFTFGTYKATSKTANLTRQRGLI